MPTIHRLQDIRVWHLSRRLVREIYLLSGGHAFRGDSSLRNQMRSAVVSIVSNIAEGFERDGNKEFIHFLSQAKGSAGEVMSQLFVAYDQQYIDEATFYRVRYIVLQTLRMLDSWMMYLRASPYKGKKFVRV